MKAIFLTLTLPALTLAATLFSENFNGGTPGTHNGGNTTLTGTGVRTTSDPRSVDIIGDLNGWFFNCGPSSNNCVDLVGNQGSPAGVESLATFNLIAGTTYTVTFDLGGSPQAPSPNYVVDVMLGSMTQTASIAPEAPLTGQSLGFLALANENNVRLSFRAQNHQNSSWGPLVDNIVLSAPDSQVPEPSTFLLLGAGLGAIWLRARR